MNFYEYINEKMFTGITARTRLDPIDRTKSESLLRKRMIIRAAQGVEDDPSVPRARNQMSHGRAVST